MTPSDEARALARASDLIDLHLDTFIPPRLWGYDPLVAHRPWFLRRFAHADLPRMDAGEVSGAMWSITTNPVRTAGGRWRTFQRNLARMQALVTRAGGRLAFARDAAEYHRVREAGAHAVLLAVQGGNAFDAAPDGPASVADRLLTRVTLVHLTSNRAGATSSPASRLRRHRGLSAHGRRQIEQLDAARVFLDLAHIHPDAFWDAVDAHDPGLPLIVTHTGVDGVRPHWRNLDDRQIRAIADSGGVVGVMFHTAFLRRRGGPRDAAMVAEHLEHIVRVGGPQAVAVGSDYDGAILPPRDLRSAATWPWLVQVLLDRGWTPDAIQGALGRNFLASWARLRPTP
ncbi:MAG: membrane dipeptidase [Myxococcales bacterium]|nr:membrane dipeptidase [Myxococcales bacterium]